MLKRIDAQLDDTVPARRAITVRDVLTSCFGFGLILAPPDTCPIQRAPFAMASSAATATRTRHECPPRTNGCAAWALCR